MPIFNFADSCIFVGVCLILFFQRRFYQQQAEREGLLPDDPDATNAAVLPMSEPVDEVDTPASEMTSQANADLAERTDEESSTDDQDQVDKPIAVSDEPIKEKEA